MKYLDLGLQRPDHGYSAPAVEQELVALGFVLL